MTQSALRRDGAEAMRLAHTDWLYHRLRVSGPAVVLAAFRTAAAGAGVIPWELDLDRMEEDWFLLAASGAHREGGLSLAGARAMARQLRGRVAARHAAAQRQVGQSRACPFDLHMLCRVPDFVLALGPDDPAAITWLWEAWGTTLALRHVSEATSVTEPDELARVEEGAGADAEAVWSVTFWAADWTPWRALSAIGRAWPGLRFALRPHYDMP